MIPCDVHDKENMTTISVVAIKESTTVDGPGLRTSIYCAGCENACPGCHNPHTWDINSGKRMTIDEIMEKILAEDFCNVTFSGGDPMFQAVAFAELAQRIKSETQKNIWCYTGYTFEKCANEPDKRKLLESIDVLVDGRFDATQKEEGLLFRGSANQRIIDVAQSLAKGEVITIDPWANLKPSI